MRPVRIYQASQAALHPGYRRNKAAMIHIALLVAYTLFLAWLGLNVLLLIVLSVVVLFRRPSGSPAEEAQEVLDRVDAYSATDGRTIAD